MQPNCTQSSGPKQCGINFASDVCVNSSPTMDSGEALMLWAKPQPGGAVAVFLVNNHPTATYADVEFSVEEVGGGGGGGGSGKELAVHDVWNHKDLGRSVNGRVFVTIPPRDSALLLLSPPTN